MTKKIKISYASMTEALKEELFRISSPDLAGRPLADEIAKASTMAYLAQSIVNVGKFEIYDIGVDVKSTGLLPSDIDVKAE